MRAVNLLLECNAFPDHTYLWWDVRPQPRLGTVEVRIMDAQSTLDGTAALVALVQSLVRLELVDGHADAALVHAPEVLDENRFLAARDGVEAKLVDPVRGQAVSVDDIVSELMPPVRAARRSELGCAEELKLVADAARRRRPRPPASPGAGAWARRVSSPTSPRTSAAACRAPSATSSPDARLSSARPCGR